MNFSNAVRTLTLPDHAVMRRMNRWRPPRWLRWWIIVATRGGDGWFWVLSGVAVLSSHDAKKYAALSAAALSAAAGILLFMTVKKVVGRKRPCLLDSNCWANLLPPDQFS